MNYDEEVVDYNNIALPIGSARVQGAIEDFNITIYDRAGNTYRFKVVGGNICACNNHDAESYTEYEVS